MKTYTNNLEIQPNHTYLHEELGNVKSVTTLINGKSSSITTRNMEEGTTVHKTPELFLKGFIEESKELYKSLSKVYQDKVKSLAESLKEINLQDSNSELSFVTQDENIKYGGTVDLLTQDLAIDFKTGKFSKSHILQIADYAKANNKQQGLILSFKDNKLEKTFVNNEEIENAYKEFNNRANNTLNLINDFAYDILSCLTSYSQLKAKIENLEESLKTQQNIIEQKLIKEGGSTYKVKNYCCFNQNGRETTTLTKEAKTLLQQSNPE